MRFLDSIFKSVHPIPLWMAVWPFILPMFCCFGQSVEPLTGRAVIDLPLGNLQVGDINIPIGISHQGGSLKVMDGEGDVGAGWRLVAGGMVSREIRGLPDDFLDATRSGWLYNGNAQAIQNFVPSADDVLSTCTDEQADFNFINGLGYLKDSEPDIYYFQAPGISGKFILGTDRTAKLLTYQDLSITMIRPNGTFITGFVIKTNKGFTYSFDAAEMSERKSATYRNLSSAVDYFTSNHLYYSTPVRYAVSWGLSKIASTASSLQAAFTYSSQAPSSGASYYTRINIDASGSPVVDTLYYLTDKVETQKLSEITLQSFKATFGVGDGRYYNITFTESETGDNKKIDFIYQVIQSTQLSSNRAYHNFLTQIREINQDCFPSPAYQFSYYGVSFPDIVDPEFGVGTTSMSWDTGQNQDHYGFYNSIAYKNTPNIFFYAGEANARRFRTSALPGLTPTIELSGNNRSINPVSIATGAVKYIYYPTGGYTHFIYEPNSYFDSDRNADVLGGGVRVASITTFGEQKKLGSFNAKFNLIQTSYEYKLTDGKSSGKLTYAPAFAFANGTTIVRSNFNLASDYPEILYSRTTEIMNGKGKRVSEFKIPGIYPQLTDGIWKATISKIARQPSAACDPGNFKNGAYTYPFAPNTTYDYKRGQLVKQMEFGQNGDLTSQRRLVYAPGAQGLTTHKGLRFERIGNAFHYGLYEILTGGSEVVSSEIVTTVGEQSPADSSVVTVNYQYNAKNLLKQITRTSPNGTVNRENLLYAGDFNFTSAVPSDTAAFAIQLLNNTSRHAEVIERAQRLTLPGMTEKVTGANLTVYANYTSLSTALVLPYKTFSLLAGAVFTDAIRLGQSLVADGDYAMDQKVERYNSVGSPIDVSNNRKNRMAYLNSGQSNTAFLTVSNAKAKQFVFVGFDERISESTLSIASGVNEPVYTTGWTGSWAARLMPSHRLISLALIQKGSVRYRISCWVKAPMAGTLTFKALNGTTEQSSVTAAFDGSNQWKKITATLNMANVSPNFAFEVATSAQVDVDDVLVLPEQASATFSLSKPFTGVVAQTDVAANSTTFTYDDQRRLLGTYDQKRNLVAYQEYANQKDGDNQLNAVFISSTATYSVGNTTTFTAIACVSNLTYTWSIKRDNSEVATGQGASITYTFAQPGTHTVLMTASNPLYSPISFGNTICVDPRLVFDIVAPNGLNIYRCDVNGNPKTFRAINLQVSPGGQVIYSWAYTSASGQWFAILDANGVPITGPLASVGISTYAYSVKCKVSISYPPDLHCQSTMVTEREVITTTVYIDNRPCP
jgi:YD repeat-containing protein